MGSCAGNPGAPTHTWALQRAAHPNPCIHSRGPRELLGCSCCQVSLSQAGFSGSLQPHVSIPIPGDTPSIPLGFPREQQPVLPTAWEDLQDFRVYISLYKTQTLQTKLFLHQKVPANSLDETLDQAGRDFPPCSQLQKLLPLLPLPQNVFLQLSLFFFREQFAVNRQNLFWTHSELLPICSICQHDSRFFFFFPGYSGLSPACGRPAASPRGDVGLEQSHG